MARAPDGPRGGVAAWDDHSRRQARSGCFFFGGVDSFSSVLKHCHEISSLVFVHGFDIALAETEPRAKASSALRRAAAGLGNELIEVPTNLLAFSDTLVEWGVRYHGAALASVARLLAARLRKSHVPSSRSYGTLEPLGSHPLLDPLWSTEWIELVHDGCEAKRLDKVALVSQSDIAMRTLRVCWERPGGEYNGGRCEKCLRTRVSLELAGALSSCTTFDRPLELGRVTRVRDPDAVFFEKNLRCYLELGHRSALARALRDSLEGKYYEGLRRFFRGDLHCRVARQLRRAFASQRPPARDMSVYEFGPRERGPCSLTSSSASPAAIASSAATVSRWPSTIDSIVTACSHRRRRRAIPSSMSASGRASPERYIALRACLRNRGLSAGGEPVRLANLYARQRTSGGLTGAGLPSATAAPARK